MTRLKKDLVVCFINLFHVSKVLDQDFEFGRLTKISPRFCLLTLCNAGTYCTFVLVSTHSFQFGQNMSVLEYLRRYAPLYPNPCGRVGSSTPLRAHCAHIPSVRPPPPSESVCFPSTPHPPKVRLSDLT